MLYRLIKLRTLWLSNESEQLHLYFIQNFSHLFWTNPKKKKSQKSNISFIVSNDLQNFKNSRNALLFIITEKFIEKMKEVVAQVHMLYTSETKNKIK